LIRIVENKIFIYRSGKNSLKQLKEKKIKVIVKDVHLNKEEKKV